MFETLDGDPVGTGSIYELDRLRSSAQWGRLCAARLAGHPHPMMEACYLVHRICFEVLGIHRMYGALASENKSSYRMTRFLDYAQEGLRRKHWIHPDGFFDDVIVVGLFADEFQQQKRTIEQRLYPELPIPPITDEQAVRIRGLVASQSQERGVSRCSGGT
ncbi:MAG: GNAT family N-acetyltransferase, partial [Planctomycetes bacterium]|nr:GNAT family N-acetyltransferase [Planctomycetota bacterium]